MSSTSPRYDERLARQVLEAQDEPVEAAIRLFELLEPDSLSAAAELVRVHGALTPTAFDHVVRAYDIYRHSRDMPCD